MNSEFKTKRNKLLRLAREYARKRDLKAGLPCISCGKYTDKLDGGHYYSITQSRALQFDEKNIFGQCRHCNRFQEGNQQGFRQGILKRYDQERLNYLNLKKNNKIKYEHWWLDYEIKEYREKIKILEGKRGDCK